MRAMHGTRRTWLGGLAVAAGAAVLVHGWNDLLGDDGAKAPAAPAPKEPAKPAWYADALAEMKATRSWGVAILVPEGARVRAAIGRGLEEAMRSPKARATFAEAVFVVVPPGVAPFEKDEGVVLLDADGRRVAGLAHHFHGNVEEVMSAVRKALRDDGRLAKRAEACRDKAFDAALGDLRAEDPAERKAASKALADHFPKWRAAILEQIELRQDAAARKPFEDAVAAYLAKALPETPALGATKLPFGAEWADSVATPQPDPCPSCGMMMPSPSGKRWLRLLGDAR